EQNFAAFTVVCKAICPLLAGDVVCKPSSSPISASRVPTFFIYGTNTKKMTNNIGSLRSQASWPLPCSFPMHEVFKTYLSDGLNFSNGSGQAPVSPDLISESRGFKHRSHFRNSSKIRSSKVDEFGEERHF